jgi:hypothetical protein
LSTLTEYTKYPQPKEIAGKSYWQTLFNIAASYSDHPDRSEKIDMHNLIKSIISKFTCQECIQHAFEFMRRHPAELDNKESLTKWLCKLKNNSNRIEGKDEIDCDIFVMNSINREGGCHSCSIQPIKAPSVNISIPKTPSIPLTPAVKKTVEYDPGFESVLNWDKRYPSLKQAINIESERVQATGNNAVVVSPEPPIGDPNYLASQYPSLAGLDPIPTGIPQEETLDGIIKPLDSIYAGPANIMGIKPHEMNLAYTPEMLTNTVSLLTQIYLTNFGSLLTTLLSSISLLGISVFAKNSMSHYDRMFIQNVTASLLFHNLNFINPRIKDEVVPHAQTFFEGVTSMNFDKVKEALLYGHKSESSAADKSAQELLEMLETKNGKIDMSKLDLRTKHGGSGSSGSLSTNELEKMLGGGKSSTPSNTNYSVLGQSQDKFSYILDNNLL